MNKEDYFIKFINSIKRRKLLTNFLNTTFNYKYLKDNNYIFIIKKINNSVIIDIYDNLDNNHFYSYIFNFNIIKKTTKKIKNGINIYYIGTTTLDNNLNKLAYIFKNHDINYAKTFLNKEFLEIYINIIKK